MQHREVYSRCGLLDTLVFFLLSVEVGFSLLTLPKLAAVFLIWGCVETNVLPYFRLFLITYSRGNILSSAPVNQSIISSNRDIRHSFFPLSYDVISWSSNHGYSIQHHHLIPPFPSDKSKQRHSAISTTQYGLRQASYSHIYIYINVRDVR